MTDDPTSTPNALPNGGNGNRKRVIARELAASEIEAANLRAAALTPQALEPRPSEGIGPVVVVDPTVLGYRHRRSSHHRVYRWTQCCTLLAAALSVASIFCTLGEDLFVARWLAAPAVGLGVVATLLAGRTSLSARWRGWAIAALVFAATALALTWALPAMTGEDPNDLKPKPRQQAPLGP